MNFKDKLFFVGGAKGVGKTTLLEKALQQFPFPIVNTGNIVIKARAEKANPEKRIYSYLNSFEGVVDTHFAGYSKKGNGFIRGLSRDTLLNLNESKEIYPILVSADFEDIYERRIKDKERKRIYDWEHLIDEIKENEKYFYQYCNELNTKGKIILNKELNESSQSLIDFLKEKI